MTGYITLAALRRYLGLAADQTADDALLRRGLIAASRLIDAYAGRWFYPARQCRAFALPRGDTLLLDGDLLALEALVNGDGSAIPAGALHLHPANSPVKSSLTLDRTQAAFVHQGDPVAAIQVTGWWGFHPAWEAAWRGSGDAVADVTLAAEAATLTVNDADGADTAGEAPRFEAGQLVRMGDELLEVLAVDADADTLTVARGVNGTLAAEHAQGDAIAIYQPPADIQQACLRVAAWLYKQKDAGFVQVAGSLRGQIVVPPALPEDVHQVLAPYVRARVV